jgi:SSS family solute:Na+ symporter
MTVKSKQSLNRGVAAGGIFILFMTGVAFVVGALSNVYFAKNEVISCKIVNETVLLDPGPDKGLAKLTLVPTDATEEVVKRAKGFISYRLPEETDAAPLHYVLKTPATVVERGGDGKADTIRPGLIAIARTITVGTTMKGNSDTIIPSYVKSAMPKWFGVLFLMTLLSAAMSTLSSQFHTMGTAIGRDIFETVAGRHSHRSVLITRLGIVVGIVTAITLGKFVRGNVVALATAIFFGLCAAAFLPAFLAGLFWKRMTRAAAIASIVVGFISSACWSMFVNGKTAAALGLCKSLVGRDTILTSSFSPTWSVVDPLLIALPLSFLTALAVSLLTKPMKPEYVSYCFGGTKPE